MPFLIEVPALSVFAIACILVMIAYAYKFTFGALLTEIVRALNAVRIPTYFFGSIRLFGVAADTIGAINNTIYFTLGKGIEANQWAFHKLTYYQGLAWQELSAAVAELAEGTLRSLDYLARHKIKALIAVATLGLSLTVPLLVARVDWLVKQLAAVPHALTKVVYRDVPHALTRTEKAAIAALVAVPKAVATAGAIALPGIGRVEREASGLAKWVRAHAGLLTVSGIAGLVVAALGRLGLGWTRCSKVGRVGKAVCGFDESLIESFVAGGLVIFGTLSLVEFADDMKGVMAEVAPQIRHFWRADRPGNSGDRPLGRAA